MKNIKYNKNFIDLENFNYQQSTVDCDCLCISAYYKMNESIMEGLYTRNNYGVHIWFNIKQQITKELSREIVDLFGDNLCDTIYNYIAANKVLMNKN